MDAAFLHNETHSSPWNIVGVLVFDPSTAPEGFNAEVLRRVIAGRIDEVDAFRRRVVDVRGVMSVPHWVLDATVDVTEHVRRAAVPGASLRNDFIATDGANAKIVSTSVSLGFKTHASTVNG